MKRFFAIIIGLCCTASAMAQVSVTTLKVNHLTSPQCIVDQNPTLSWIVEGEGRNLTQSAYEIMVYEGSKRIWSSGKVLSDNSTAVRYEGEPLKSGTRYSWQVRVWDNNGKASKWSQRASWLTGLFSLEEFKAEWIEPQSQGEPAPMFRKVFPIKKPIASAILYATAHGVYEAEINGQKVGEWELTPGWTMYNHRLQYQAYDVTSVLTKGNNCWGITAGKGWYNSKMWGYSFPIQTVGVLGQIVITYKDGQQEIIATDKSWKCSTGSILYSTIYHGETIDATQHPEGWSMADFNDSEWSSAKECDYPKNHLIATENEPIKVKQIMKPVQVITTPAGEKVLDFGQNLVGREIFTYKGKPNQKITIYHAEVLDENGNFYTKNLRTAKATSTYICSGGDDRFEAKFSFYGFRYLKVEGIEEELNPDNFEAAVLYSDLEDNGSFISSNEQVNQLQSNVRWGMAGNFLDVPTDCPQRDERMGWTNDALNFFRTATFNRNVHTFFLKWLKDLALGQRADGAAPDVVPTYGGGFGAVGWADAATLIPWQHYMAYGDKQVLENQYESMKAWADYVYKQAEDMIWRNGWHYGDWLFYSVDNDTAGNSAVSFKPVLQQCFFAKSTQCVADAAKVLGKDEDAKIYAERVREIKKAFCDAFLTPRGFLTSHTQTAYVLALQFDMVPQEMRPALAANLARDVRERGHITTGFLGTPLVCHALSENGYADLAYKVLLRQDYPGWLYPVRMGATTIWERWNSMMPDRTIPDNGMNSFNHYSYGSIGDWLYRAAVGIQETSPGFKTLAIKPHVGGGFTFMKAEQLTPYGRVAAEWHDEEGIFSLAVTIPVNTTAEIYVPSPSKEKVLLDGQAVESCADVKVAGYSDGYTKIEVGSGKYLFEVK